MSLGETRPGPTRPVRLHRRLLQPTTDPLCHRLQNARTSREASGVTPVSIKSGDHQYEQRGVSAAARTLPVTGETAEARRNTVRRAVRIASIAPEAREAAREAGL